MRFPAKTTSDFELAPEGNHVAICNAIVDLGMQPGTAMYPTPKHQVYVRFELCNELVERDGEKAPVVIGKTFTASMHEKAGLRKFIEGWFGKKFPNDAAAADFDVSKLLSRQCLANVAHYEGKDGKERAGLQSVSPIPKGMDVSNVKQHSKSMFFDLTQPDDASYQALPEWLRDKIDDRIVSKPDESAPASNYGDFDDDQNIPF